MNTPAVTNEQMEEFHKKVISADDPVTVSNAIREFARSLTVGKTSYFRLRFLM